LLDNLVERLAKEKLNIVRVGHPARLLPSALSYSLDVIVQTSPEGDIVKQVQKDMDELLKTIRKSKRRSERRDCYKQLKDLRKEYKQRERKVVQDIVKEAVVVLSTLSGCAGKEMKHWNDFDTVIIDEATQAIEAESWIGVLKGQKLILAGDHLQLPPTIKSMKEIPSPIEAMKKIAKDKRIKSTTPNDEVSSSSSGSLDKARELSSDFVTLFDRLLVLFGDKVKSMLTVQYRANEAIMAFSSTMLYFNRLVADDSVKDRLLMDLPKVETTDETSCPLVMIDTMNSGMWEKTPEDGGDGNSARKLPAGAELESKLNENEVELVKKHVQLLSEAGVTDDMMAVISPYSAQVWCPSGFL
jgi:DNA polymerase alpha-associated DNA helicase A